MSRASKERERQRAIRAMKVRVAWEVDHIEEASRVHDARILAVLGIGFALGIFLGWAFGVGPPDLGNFALELLFVGGVAGGLLAVVFGAASLFSRFAKRLGYPVREIQEAFRWLGVTEL